MQLTDADLREFAHIWAEEFHESITEEEAKSSASMLLDLYWLLASQGGEEDL